MAEAVMGPVIGILVGAVLIAGGLGFFHTIGLGIGIVLATAGIATILVGMVMLFNLARQDKG
ncbi:MAG TPA: hypothetical protein VMT44_06980 [Methanoregula sp.]|nr:hypothetical protein [Methanoregula sp.]